MQPSVICLTDCTDANATARLGARIAALFGRAPALFPLTGPRPELTAGLTLLDCLLATELLGEPGEPTVVLVNIAPRDGHWPNGVPFCWFRYGQHLVVSTFNPPVLALVRRYLGIEQVQLTDVREVMEAAAAGWASFGPNQVDTVATTQFRSLWYLPLLARWVGDGRPVPATATDVPDDDATVRVAVVDNFGNCKLNTPGDAIGFSTGEVVEILAYSRGRALGVRQVRCHRRLSDVPRGEAALVIGSSGRDFVELVVGCGSAASEFGLQVGSEVGCLRTYRDESTTVVR